MAPPRLALILAAVVASLAACSSADPARQQDPTLPRAGVSVTPPPTPRPTPIPLRVAVREYHEPLDHAHRNYCGAGATEVLLSAWLPALPDIETVAHAIALDPNRGTTGADTVAGVNVFLAPVARDRYTGAHVTEVDALLQRLRADLGDAGALRSYGHTVPVMVQTMTKTMPGWGGWQATHMITISAADLDTGNPDVDTVTYAETPSPIAGYNGPPFQTITVHALWTAMQEFLADDPADTINVIA